MLRNITRRIRVGHAPAVRTATAMTFGLLVLAGCSNIVDPLLEADDPDIISPDNIDSPDGADALYRGALDRLSGATGGGENTWLYGGLLADEFGTSSTFVQNDEVDIRRVQTSNSRVTSMYRDINRVRTSADQAIAALQKWRPDSREMIAEMYFARAFAEAQLAQDFCSAIPLSNGSGEEILPTGPLSTQEVFDHAVASYDSALALVAGSSSGAGLRVARAASIGKARALLGNGHVAEAALAVRDIPTDYSYDVTFSLSSSDNIVWSQIPSQRRYLVGDSVEGNARDIIVKNNLPFFSAQDPRVPASYTFSASGADTIKSQDGSTLSRTTTLFDRFTPIAIVNGLDARLVEAEAALKSGDPNGMLAILNALRAAPPVVGQLSLTSDQLPPLTLPATPDAQLDLLFREKAFWTYSRGQRLGDMRRLIRQYGRTADNTFPVGPHYRGGEYGTDVNLPVPQQEETNPEFGPAGRLACLQDQA